MRRVFAFRTSIASAQRGVVMFIALIVMVALSLEIMYRTPVAFLFPALFFALGWKWIRSEALRRH